MMKAPRIALAATAIAGLLFTAVAVAQTPVVQDRAVEDVRASGGSPKAVTPPQAEAQVNPKQKSTAQPPPDADKSDPQQQCVKNGEFAVELGSGRHPVGDTIVLPSNFLPTAQRVEVGIRTTYVDNLRYFAALDRNANYRGILARQDVVTRRAVGSDELVKNGEFCGAPNIHLHFARETQLVREQVELAGKLGEERHELAYRLMGNAHEDVLTAFEATLKTVYSYKVAKQQAFAADVKPVGNAFQNIERGRKRFAEFSFDRELKSTISKISGADASIETRGTTVRVNFCRTSPGFTSLE